jgi:hypothetical protein
MKTEENNTRYLLRYRAWNRDDGTLYKWSVFDNYPLKDLNGTFPQEFTGLHDKNLNDIYLGDIVNYLNDNYLVRFFEGSYILYKLENISTLKFYWFNKVVDKFKEMEVVGNTFEHAQYLNECYSRNINSETVALNS